MQPGRRVSAAHGPGMGILLSGTLLVRIGFDEHLLGPGDAISFDSAAPHRLFNAGDVPARAVWFVLGRGSVDVVEALTRAGRGARRLQRSCNPA